jgi:hypothetical protein
MGRQRLHMHGEQIITVALQPELGEYNCQSIH